MELHMEAPTQEAYSQDAERNVPALQPAFLVSQQPTTELLMQIGRMYQEEMFEHKATKRMLHIQTMQRKQAEKGLWEAQIGNANAGRMLEWYQHTLNERVDSEPFVIRLREALENEQQTSNLLRSQLAQLEEGLPGGRRESTTTPLNMERAEHRRATVDQKRKAKDYMPWKNGTTSKGNDKRAREEDPIGSDRKRRVGKQDSVELSEETGRPMVGTVVE
ncbi:MAG: hypothetical protein Q9159_000400 [Coniocarpon cinnabarinum]